VPIVCDPATVKILCREFSTLDDPTVATFISAAQAQVNNVTDIGADRLALLQIYLTGHLLATANPDLYAGGPVASETVGQVSRSYGVPMLARVDELNLTRFGSEYKRLLRGTGLSFLVS
jgi:hypothetical protein